MPATTDVKSRALRLLTFNLQVGIQTSAYHHYLTRSWQHLLPHPHRRGRLDAISAVLKDFDLVGLQEADGGSFRSGQLNQVEYLARQAGFEHHFQQLNRDLGRVAQHSNGLLSKHAPTQIDEHRLPGMLPGRGAIHVRFGKGDDALHVFIAHLALGQRTRDRQFDFLGELMTPLRHVVMMGDLNCPAQQILDHPGLTRALALRTCEAQPSYPAWKPRHALDHILVSDSLEATSTRALNHLFSDHLPVAIDLSLPPACALATGLLSSRLSPSLSSSVPKPDQ